jgi:uncharacterized protein (DUF1800 family)
MGSAVDRHDASMTIAPPAPSQSDDTERRASIAHVLRRMTFLASGDNVDRYVDQEPLALIESLLASAQTDAMPASPSFGTSDDNGVLIKWWTILMVTSEAPLIERMTWFWHGHLTSSLGKGGSTNMVCTQNQLVRKYAMGNFRELMKAITIDASMLLWLDGNWSVGSAPNENYSRELMELFTLGRGNYSEGDVRAAAKGLAGYAIENDRVSFADDRAFAGDVTLFGKTAHLDANGVIDAIVDHPACAPFIAGKLHRFFLGTDPSKERLDELAATFRDNDTNIRPVVENIVRHSSFLDPTNRYARIRGPVEWRAAAQAALGVDIEWNALWDFGQVPFFPPNVAGWPDDRRWLAASPTLLRAHAGRDHSIVVDTPDFARWALRRAALDDASSSTLDAIRSAVDRVDERRAKASVALALAVSCPEFELA